MTRPEIAAALRELRQLLDAGRHMEPLRRGTIEDRGEAATRMRSLQAEVARVVTRLQAAPEPYAGWARGAAADLGVAVSCTQAAGPLSALAAADRAERCIAEAEERLGREGRAN